MDEHKESLEELTKRVRKEVQHEDTVFWVKWAVWVVLGLLIIGFVTK